MRKGALWRVRDDVFDGRYPPENGSRTSSAFSLQESSGVKMSVAHGRRDEALATTRDLFPNTAKLAMPVNHGIASSLRSGRVSGLSRQAETGIRIDLRHDPSVEALVHLVEVVSPPLVVWVDLDRLVLW